MKTKKQDVEKSEYEIGSDNVFADLGFENPDEDIIKSYLVGEIAHLIKKKKLTQMQAAKILGVDQPRVSSLLRGQLELFSIGMLMYFLNDLGRDVEILVKAKPKNRKRARSRVNFSRSESKCTIPMAAKSH